jgi:hypothetical protein
VIQIAITQAAFDAIAPTMPVGSVGYEAKANATGERADLAGRARR